MNVSRIRGFLLQLPKPTSIRITGDGEPQTLKPSKSYAKTADTIAALSAELVECLDAEGNILRALRLDATDARRSDAAEIPDALKQDPQALLLTHFANLLHRAYEHSTEVAFTRMVDMADRMNERSDSIEQRLERAEASNRKLLQEQVDDAFDRARELAEQRAEEQGGDLGSTMLSAFMGGNNQPKPAPKATNGKS